MKKLRAEIKLMKLAFMAISLLMSAVFGFMLAVMEETGASVFMVIILVLVMIVMLLSLAASGVLPFGSEEDESEQSDNFRNLKG